MTKRREAVEISLQCSRAVSQQAEEAAASAHTSKHTYWCLVGGWGGGHTTQQQRCQLKSRILADFKLNIPHAFLNNSHCNLFHRDYFFIVRIMRVFSKLQSDSFRL